MKYKVARAYIRMLGYKPMFEKLELIANNKETSVFFSDSPGRGMLGYDGDKGEWYTLYVSDNRYNRNLIKVLNAEQNDNSPS